MLNLEPNHAYEITNKWGCPMKCVVGRRKIHSEYMHSYFATFFNDGKKVKHNCGMYIWDHGVANNKDRRTYHDGSVIVKCRSLNACEDAKLRSQLR